MVEDAPVAVLYVDELPFSLLPVAFCSVLAEYVSDDDEIDDDSI